MNQMVIQTKQNKTTGIRALKKLIFDHVYQRMLSTVFTSWWLLGFLAHCALSEPTNKTCTICNIPYAETKNLFPCKCNLLEYCNVTGGPCIEVDGKSLCSGICEPIST